MKNPFLDSTWQKAHYKGIALKAGHRYSPQLNIELPITKTFDYLGRTETFYDEIRKHTGDLSRLISQVVPRKSSKELQKVSKKLRDELVKLEKLLMQIKSFDSERIDWEEIKKHADKSSELMWDTREEIRKARNKDDANKAAKKSSESRFESSSRLFDSESYALSKLQPELNFFTERGGSKDGQLSNTPRMSLEGQSGIGKTHLICDLVRLRFEDNLPTMMLFGQDFIDGQDILSQILQQSKLTKEFSNPADMLLSLDRSAIESKTRSIIIIDALNETIAKRFWKTNLNKFLIEVDKYKNIAVILSVRSGFEKEVYDANTATKLISIKHEGFTYREWEAIIKFFREYSIPLPEIPILTPEFQVPLFLKLFCEGVGQRLSKKKNKEAFRGHEGATFIFETFTKFMADDIAREFGLPKGKNAQNEYVIWDTVIERFAEVMVRKRVHKDLIFPREAKNVIVKAHPSANPEELLQSLERHTLVTKIPIYPSTSKKTRYAYRFPYQKFSDHLISRYLLKKYDPKSKNFRKNFNKNAVFGKLIKSHSIGLIEALSIQIPERTKGKELFQLASWAKDLYLVKDAFLESIIWRVPTRFAVDSKGKPKYVFNYLNKWVLKEEDYFHKLLNVLISVSPNPIHPMNAWSLHRYLLGLGIKKRDAWWSTFLHYQNGERGAVDRIIEWAWSIAEFQKIEDETTKLTSITLIWFLSTPNRYVRDRATKALVALLTNRINVIPALLRAFEKVDDYYIQERIYAVAYGSVLRSDINANEDIKSLSRMIYRNLFSKRNPPPHLLLRDYASGVIKEAMRRKINLGIDTSKIFPPYTSKPPDTAPEFEKLKKKYYPKNFNWDSSRSDLKGSVGIWRSLMYATAGGLADFGNYELGSAISKWSSRRLTEPIIKSASQKRKEFERKLSPQQLKAYQEINALKFSSIRIEFVDMTGKNKKKDRDVKSKQADQVLEEALNNFFAGLTPKQQKQYADVTSSRSQPDNRFDQKLAERWLLNKVMTSWYDPKLHGDFDSVVQGSRDRGAPKTERIGKKYQWMGMQELLARIADNYQFKGASWSEDISKYRGAWETWERDIDPSNISRNDRVKIHEKSPWWNNVRYEMKGEEKDWLKNPKDLPSLQKIIELKDDKGTTWLSLGGFVEWEEKIPPESDPYNRSQKRLSYILKSYIVRKSDKGKFLNWLREQKDFYNDTLPPMPAPQGIFLREFPYHEAFTSIYGKSANDDWTNDSSFSKMPVQVVPTVMEYSSSISSNDGSSENGETISLPSRWLLQKMKLKFSDIEGEFINGKKEIICKDPTVGKDSHTTLLIKMGAFLKLLADNDCEIIWTVLGEKQILGVQGSGYMAITGIAHFVDEKLTVILKTENR